MTAFFSIPGEVLNVVTYAYTFQQADDQPPLPQPDEVLLCTEDTSVEEVTCSYFQYHTVKILFPLTLYSLPPFSFTLFLNSFFC